MSLHRKIKKWLAVGIPLAMLVGLTGLAAAPAAFADQPANLICPDGTDGYGPKIDTTGDPATVSVTADPGMLIDSYCVKAGSDGYVIVPVDPPATTVVIDHPTKDSVSHYSLHQIPIPVVDVCANLEGNQATVPDGYMQDGDNCILAPPIPNVAVASVTVTPATCDSAGTASFTIDNATWDGPATLVDGNWVRSATSNPDALFANNTTHVTVTYQLEDILNPNAPPCYTPPTVYPTCTGSTTLPVSTNLNAQGWIAENGTYVAGGLKLGSPTEASYVYKTFSTPIHLSEVAPLGFTATDAPWGGILVYNADYSVNVHYEPYYSNPLWTNSPGILPAGGGGQGSAMSGDFGDLLSNPLVTEIAFWVNPGHEAVLSSLSFNCMTQSFDFVAAPTPLSGNDVQSQTDCDTATVTVTTTPWTQGYIVEGNKWVLGDKVYGEATVTTGEATNAELNAEECAAPEPPEVTPTVTTQEKADCDSGVVNITTTTTTPVFTYDSENRVWVEGEPTVKVEPTTRAMTPKEKANCTPVLAFTGADTGALFGTGALAFLLLVAGCVAVAAVAAIRRRKTKSVTE